MNQVGTNRARSGRAGRERAQQVCAPTVADGADSGMKHAE